MRQIKGDCPRLKEVNSEEAEQQVCLNCDVPECWEDLTYDQKWVFIRRERAKRPETDRRLTSDERGQSIISATD